MKITAKGRSPPIAMLRSQKERKKKKEKKMSICCQQGTIIAFKPDNRVQEPADLRDLARDLVCPDRVFNGLLLLSKVGPKENQGEGNTEPQNHQGNKRSEGNSRRGLLGPDEQIQEKEDQEEDAREEGSSLISQKGTRKISRCENEKSRVVGTLTRSAFFCHELPLKVL